MIKMIEGVCKGCGQAQMVKIDEDEFMTEAGEKEKADKLATARCGCPESQKIAAWDQALGTINRVCAEDLEKLGFIKVSQEAKESIIGAAVMVFEDRIDTAGLEVADSKITIKKKSDGLNLSIIRKSTLEVGN